MRSSSFFFLSIALVAALLACCNSSTSTNSNSNFSADLNGTQWLPRSTVSGVYDSSVNEIWINATNSKGASMWVFIDSTEFAPGTYNAFGGYADSSVFGSYYWHFGQLSLSAVSKTHASGTFYFTARQYNRTDSVNITNGEFNVAIYPGLIPN
jgi:hypothetical protein